MILFLFQIQNHVKLTYPNRWDSRASSFVCHTMCLWRKYHIWHRPCRETRWGSVHLHMSTAHHKQTLLIKWKYSRVLLITSAVLIMRLDSWKWTEVIVDSQSTVLWPNFPIYGGEREQSGRWGKGKFNLIFRWWILTAKALVWSSYCTVRGETCLVGVGVFGHQIGGEPVVGVWSVSPLSSVHPARLWGRTLPDFSLMDKKVRKTHCKTNTSSMF